MCHEKLEEYLWKNKLCIHNFLYICGNNIFYLYELHDLLWQVKILLKHINKIFNLVLSNKIDSLSDSLKHQTEITNNTQNQQCCSDKRGFYFSKTGKCYIKRSLTTQNWDDARAECKKNGGDLATITDQATMDFVLQIVNDIEKEWTKWIWIGAEKNSGIWSWADGTPWTDSIDRLWNHNNPRNSRDNGAVAISPSFGWDDWVKSGTVAAEFLCQF